MIRSSMTVLALCMSGSLAVAQTPPTTPGQPSDAITHAQPPVGVPASIQLTTAQKSAILNAIGKDSRKPSPVNFVATIGAPVPPSIELYMLPDSALADVPQAKFMKYTMVQTQVVLVDPTTMRVVDVLQP